MYVNYLLGTNLQHNYGNDFHNIYVFLLITIHCRLLNTTDIKQGCQLQNLITFNDERIL